MYFQGIYAADAFAKSEGYSYNPNRSSKSKLALLCEVSTWAVLFEQVYLENFGFYTSGLK